MKKSLSMGGIQSMRPGSIRSRNSQSNLIGGRISDSGAGSPDEEAGLKWPSAGSSDSADEKEQYGKSFKPYRSGKARINTPDLKDRERKNSEQLKGSDVKEQSANTKQMEKIFRWSVVAISLCLLGYLSWAISPLPLHEHKRPISAHIGGRGKRELTVMINTFKRPPQVVDDAIEFYAECEVVRYIYIVWSEETEPPQRLTAKYKQWKVPSVGFQKQASTSLNNRFRPLLDVPHSDGVFAVDDDMRVPCDDLDTAYDVWQGSRDSLVGFMPRVHLRKKNGLLEYRCWWRVWWHGVYSIVLTKAAIFNHKFLELYTTAMPQSIRDLVDTEKNCEDLAMQFLIANTTGLPPIYVKGHLSDLGVFSGISTSKGIAAAGHMDARSQCLNDLETLYGHVPLIPSRIIVDNAGNWWVNAPSSWWEFISSDLWAGFFSDPD